MNKVGLFLCLIVFAVSCAKIVSPSGGPVDMTPPKLVRSVPETNSVNFSKGDITLYFDEYVELDDIQNKLLVSPPLKKNPEVKAYLKTVRVSGLDSLRENTTYILDFSDAIKDFNEGNRMRRFSYAFSTGDFIDSLTYEGRVVDAFSLKGVPNRYVVLYENADTAYIRKNIPDYITRSDSSGFFSFSNLSDGTYRILIFEDKNQNRIYDLPTEGVGFSNRPVRPYQKDSLSVERMKDNLFSYSDYEDTTQKLSASRIMSDGRAVVAFARGLNDGCIAEVKKPSADDVLVCYSANRDTLTIWRKGTAVMDSLEMEVRDGEFVERVSLYDSPSGRNRERKTFDFRPVVKDTSDFFKPYEIESSVPVLSERIPAVMIDGEDTAEVFFVATGDAMRFRLETDLKEGGRFELMIDSNVVESCRMQGNALFSHFFYRSKPDDYGELVILLHDTSCLETNRILYLSDESGKVTDTVNGVRAEDRVVFRYLKEGNYNLKMVMDDNGNGKWDKADFGLGREAEKVLPFEKTLRVRRSWQSEETWEVGKSHKKLH